MPLACAVPHAELPVDGLKMIWRWRVSRLVQPAVTASPNAAIASVQRVRARVRARVRVRVVVGSSGITVKFWGRLVD